MPRRVAALEVAKDDAFSLTASHRISWNTGASRPRSRGCGPAAEPGKPQVEVLPSEFLDGAQRERVRARLAKYVEGLVGKELGILAAIEAKAEAEGALRGPAFLLREQLGLAAGGTEAEHRPGPAAEAEGDRRPRRPLRAVRAGSAEAARHGAPGAALVDVAQHRHAGAARPRAWWRCNGASRPRAR